MTSGTSVFFVLIQGGGQPRRPRELLFLAELREFLFDGYASRYLLNNFLISEKLQAKVIDQFRCIKIQPITIDLSFCEFLGNNYRVCGGYSPEPRAEIYCVRLT